MQYQSRYSPNKLVSARQYIIEIICEKRAEHEETTLPIKFWNLPKWSQFYRSQLRLCDKLLNKYSSSAILQALRDKKCFSTYSLGAPWLKPVIEKYEKLEKEKIRQKESYVSEEIDESLLARRQDRAGEMGILGRLEEIDNEE